MSERPPGWYPDAASPGYERWWDGGSWGIAREAPGAAAAAVREHAARQAAARRAAAAGSTSAGLTDRPPDAGYPPAPGYPPTPGYPPSSGYPPAPGYPPPGGYPGYSGYPGHSGYGALPRTTPDGAVLSAPGWRLLACTIDSMIVTAVSLVVGFSFVRDLLDAMRSFVDEVNRAASAHTTAPSATDLLNEPGYARGVFGLTVTLLVVGAVYEIPLIALRGATLGKMAAGVRVRPWVNDIRPGWGRAVLRWFSRDVIALIPTLGAVYSILDSLWLLWDPKRQCLHDKIPATVVIRTRR